MLEECPICHRERCLVKAPWAEDPIAARTLGTRICRGCLTANTTERCDHCGRFTDLAAGKIVISYDGTGDVTDAMILCPQCADDDSDIIGG